ncbi:hypothetical protein J2Z32_002460 [Paenibacillus turicensis]|uniref:Uncharacterized protein n=1 Tax=Paenibacillus turicensis TaxID=160487 RepID=A0ABS4FTA7_9BACL|nr:hypothetical protein [Paenibacillus turicensis]MBP1905812.1 hypothetical protein [Paenibacillus turicensis]
MTPTLGSIPWQRLTTAYGRGTEIPQLIADMKYRKISELIEHQGTLWQVTPWVLLVLLQELREKQPEQITADEINLYLVVAEVIPIEELDLDSSTAVKTMDMLLDEKYLWPVDEEEDELEWEEEEAIGYDTQAFRSYYYFSYVLLQEALPVFKRILAEHGNDDIRSDIEELIGLLTS